MSETLQAGLHAVVYTSREVHTQSGESGLRVGAQVSDALVELVRRIDACPAFVVAKGGITSSRIATDALGVQRARVLGQILPGVPVWRLGPETRLPGVAYVVFPGNVGESGALVNLFERLTPPET